MIRGRKISVLLVGNYAYQGQASMQRFACMLHEGLKGRDDVEVRLLRPAPVLGRLRPGEAGIGKWLGYVDRLLLFPLALARAARSAEVVHICDHGNAMYVSALRGVPHMITCHDLLGVKVARGEVPGAEASRLGRRGGVAMVNGLARAPRVACISEATRADLLRLMPPGFRATTTVIHMGLDPVYEPMGPEPARTRLERLGIPGRRLLLHVGGNQWYKNRLGLLRIFAALREYPEFEAHRLVLVGKPWTEEMRRFVVTRGLTDHVHELVGIPDVDLCALYSTADALVFPSLQEGFGWPIIEAQACGCPVFATGRPPMTTAGGEAAVYFDPEQVDDAASTIRRHWARREDRRRAGLENARRYTRTGMIQRYVEQYEALVGDGSRG